MHNGLEFMHILIDMLEQFNFEDSFLYIALLINYLKQLITAIFTQDCELYHVHFRFRLKL